MEEWYPGAIRRDGLSEKQGYEGVDTNAIAGVVCHDSVGPLAATFGELDKIERRASWTFTIDTDGTIYQHYQLSAVTWHCGSEHWNAALVGIEHTRFNQRNGLPIADAQLRASVALVHWIAAQGAFPLARPGRLHEHNEVAPSNDPTSCPSGRIPWSEYTMVSPDSPGPTAAEFRAFFALEQLRFNLFIELARAFGDLAKHVYGDDDPRLAKLEAQLTLADTLAGKKESPATPPTDGG